MSFAVYVALLLAAATSLAVAQPPPNCGDVDGNGIVSAADGSALEGRLLDPTRVVCGGLGGACADLNANGSIDVGDRIVLAKLLAGADLLYAACTGPAAPTCPSAPVSGEITHNTHWGPAPCTVDLAGWVRVAAPAVLTVAPGVVVRGVPYSLLLVTPGAKLDANGSPTSPIVFTTALPPGERDPAWGGVVLSGTAPVNWEGGVGFIANTLYGGNEPADNSGRLRYVRIEFADEFNLDDGWGALTLAGVGTGTVIDHVQAHRSGVMGFIWLGGTVRAKYLVATGCRRHEFYWSDGWRGAVQFAVGHDVPFIPFDPFGGGEHGLQGANSTIFGFDVLPRSAPRMCNLTVLGSRAIAPNSGSGVNLRFGTAGIVSNALVGGWGTACLDLDTAETLARACTDATTLRTGPDVLRVQHTLCFDNGSTGATQVTGSATAPACTPAQAYGLWAAQHGLVPADPVTAGPDPDIPAAAAFPPSFATADYRPGMPLPAPDCKALDSAFFTPAPYVGAFAHGGPNWLLDAPPCAAGQVAGCWLSADLN